MITKKIREMINDISTEAPHYTITDDRILTVIDSLCNVVDKLAEELERVKK